MGKDTKLAGPTRAADLGLEVDHRDGCSANPARLETYQVDRPRDAGGGTIDVARCHDCGRQAYSEELTPGVAPSDVA